MKYLWFFNIMLFFPSLLNCGSIPDFIVEGMEVKTNGYDITAKTIDWTIQTTEDEVNVVYPGLDLRGLIEENGLELEYVPNDSFTDILGKTVASRAAAVYLLSGHKIISRMFNYPGFFWNCVYQRSTLSHEIMHFIAEYYLGTSERDNKSHAIPYYFTMFYYQSGGDVRDTIEYRVYEAAKTECIAEYGEQSE